MRMCVWLHMYSAELEIKMKTLLSAMKQLCGPFFGSRLKRARRETASSLQIKAVTEKIIIIRTSMHSQSQVAWNEVNAS